MNEVTSSHSRQKSGTLWKRLRVPVLAPAVPLAAVFAWMAGSGQWPPEWVWADWVSAAIVSVGGVSAGVVSVGAVSTGVVSIGLLSFGVLSVGVVSSGSLAVGLWVAGLYLTRPLAPRLWEMKFRTTSYHRDRQKVLLDPLRDALEGGADKRVLDLACGTGWLARALIAEEWFTGTIEASDGSESMLERFRAHLGRLPADARARITLSREDLRNWPGRPGQTFDAAVLVEVGEMLPDLPGVIGSIAGLLRDDGLLVLTRTPAPFNWMFPARHQSRARLRTLLQAHGFTEPAFRSWTWRYEVVLARKSPRGTG